MLRNQSITFTDLRLKTTPSGKQYVEGKLPSPIAVTFRRLGEIKTYHTDILKIRTDSAVYRYADIVQNPDNSVTVNKERIGIIVTKGKDDMDFWLE